jgi:hypothetical protein
MSMMQPLRGFLFLIATLAPATRNAGQEPVESLKDIARRTGGAVASQITGESPRLSLLELTQMADLIVRARLTDMTTRLSDDETTVFRDFTVLPMAAIKQPKDLVRSRTPRPTQVLTFRRRGGTLTVDGLHLTTYTNFEHRESAMAVGQEYFLFLTKALPARSTTMATGTGVYELSSEHWGVYPICNGRIVKTNFVAQRTERTTDDPEAFAALIRDLAKQPIK